MQEACKKAKKDPGQLPVETSEIQRLFGESTQGGIEWQFREIKALARAQEKAVEDGRNPAELKIGPGRPKLSTTPPSTAKKTGVSTGSKRKRVGKASAARMSDEDVGDDSESDNDAKYIKSEEEKETPAKRRNTGKPRASVTKASSSSSALAASKSSGNVQSAKNAGVARTLFPRSGYKNSASGSGSIFGNGEGIGTRNNAQVIDDSDDEVATRGRQLPQRLRRVKQEGVEHQAQLAAIQEQEAQLAAAQEQAIQNPVYDDSAYTDGEFTDGEV
ncbi:hypothetical protein F5Y02DRAFT_37722 [Annulohypoxylon stygium]|nr:hypothetical protein F5Y02DRAFT_37722 [Annulohypoxylon stygium]